MDCYNKNGNMKTHARTCSYGPCTNLAAWHGHWGSGCGHLCQGHKIHMDRASNRLRRVIQWTELETTQEPRQVDRGVPIP